MSQTKTLSNVQASGWAVICHLSALGGWVFPLGNIILPLIFWLIKKNQNEFINQTGRAILNFQISYVIYFCAYILLLVLGTAFVIGQAGSEIMGSDFFHPDMYYVLIGIFFLLNLIISFGWLALVIIGAVKAHNLKVFKYIIAIPFFKVNEIKPTRRQK